ncbi:hypothetical protein TNCV_3953471 [Trichonephila clavipes]|nr:hypothetical protein TNCV_3953471 [Trichonephila clavipes]
MGWRLTSRAICPVLSPKAPKKRNPSAINSVTWMDGQNNLFFDVDSPLLPVLCMLLRSEPISYRLRRAHASI